MWVEGGKEWPEYCCDHQWEWRALGEHENHWEWMRLNAEACLQETPGYREAPSLAFLSRIALLDAAFSLSSSHVPGLSDQCFSVLSLGHLCYCYSCLLSYFWRFLTHFSLLIIYYYCNSWMMDGGFWASRAGAGCLLIVSIFCHSLDHADSFSIRRDGHTQSWALSIHKGKFSLGRRNGERTFFFIITWMNALPSRVTSCLSLPLL